MNLFVKLAYVFFKIGLLTVGGGLAMAMSADIRIMKRSARLMAGYPRIGGSPDGGLSYTLPQAMNYEQAARFLLENRTVEGDGALAAERDTARATVASSAGETSGFSRRAGGKLNGSSAGSRPVSRK